VAEAQELGVAVVLIGIEAPAGERNQAETLVREADDRIILSRTECLEFMADVRPRGGSVTTAGVMAQLAANPETQDLASARVPGGNRSAARITADAYETFGAGFAVNWRDQNSDSAYATLVAGHPRLPVTIDGPLLRAASAHFSVALADPDRRAIRAGFWRVILAGR
jgi:hypothetical protein